MAKKALCVGINDNPYDGFDLMGCINDANAWAELLINNFDFPQSDVKIITDSQATKKSMIAEIENLLASAKAGDVLVFTNSSHGSHSDRFLFRCEHKIYKLDTDPIAQSDRISYHS